MLYILCYKSTASLVKYWIDCAVISHVLRFVILIIIAAAADAVNANANADAAAHCCMCWLVCAKPD